MAETTRIITVEFTVVDKEGRLRTKEETKKLFESFCKEFMDIDDVHITKIQDFEQDKEV